MTNELTRKRVRNESRINCGLHVAKVTDCQCNKRFSWSISGVNIKRKQVGVRRGSPVHACDQLRTRHTSHCRDGYGTYNTLPVRSVDPKCLSSLSIWPCSLGDRAWEETQKRSEWAWCSWLSSIEFGYSTPDVTWLRLTHRDWLIGVFIGTQTCLCDLLPFKFLWSKLLGYTTYYAEHALNPA
jgi:hypothetical protein